MKTRRPHITGLSLALSLFALVVASAQAGAAKPDIGKVKQTARPVLTLAMDGPRVAYMRIDRRVGVWNIVTGKTSLITGAYPSNGKNFGYGRGEVAIAGRRVALLTRFSIGNSQETQERLYTAALGRSAHQIGAKAIHATGPQCFECGNPGFATGDWIAGVVGSGKTLAVSTWTSDQSVSSDERLSLVTPTGLRTIATGRGAIVAESSAGGRIAVLRSTGAWPADGVGPPTTAPTVGIYDRDGTLLGEIPVSIPVPGNYYPQTTIRVALSGNRLVVLTLTSPQAGFLTSTLEVYDWTRGALTQTWPLTLNHGSPGTDELAVSGRIAVLGGAAFRLRLFDLTTGKTTTIAGSRPNSPATLGSRGLVYAVNPARNDRAGKLVFVPTTNLLVALGQ